MMLHGLRLSSSLASRQATRLFSSKQLIINAVGSDRLGIVSDMTKYVTDMGGNVGESQAAKLGSHFSLMMLVTVPEAKVDELTSQLSSMTDMNASVYHSTEGKMPTPKIGYSGKFMVEGADHPGIVHKVTSILSKNGLSIDKMETSDEIAPHGGTMLFKMKGRANALEPLASGFDISQIKKELAELGDSMNCDISLEDARDDDEHHQGSLFVG